MTKFLNKNLPHLERLLIFIAALFPFTITALLLLRRFGKNIPDNLPYLLLSFLFFLGLVFIARNFNKLEKIPSKYRYFGIITFLAFATILPRLWAIDFFQTPPASDFYVAFKVAKEWTSGPSLSPQHFFFQHWGVYTLFLAKSFILFGKTLFVAKALNIFTAVVTTFALFFVLKKITGKTEIGFVGATVLALWPSYVAYSNILSGEHLFIMFFTLALLPLTTAIEKGKPNYKKILLFGVLLTLANLFKETNIITLPISLFVFASQLLPVRNLKQYLLRLTLIMLIVFFTSAAVTKIAHGAVSIYAKGPINYYKTGYFFATGLNFETGGRYDEKTANKYVDPLKKALGEGSLTDEVYKKSDQELTQATIENIKENKNLLPMLFVKKIYTVWSSEEEINNWHYESFQLMGVETDLENLREGTRKYNLLSNSYFFFICIFTLLGLRSLFKSKEGNSVILFTVLFILGFSTALTFIEVLTRYRSILYPVIAILTAVGIDSFAEGPWGKKLIQTLKCPFGI